MELSDAVRCEGGETKEGSFPADARVAISILNGEAGPEIERRRFSRTSYEIPAAVELIDEPIPTRRTIFTRDASQWGLGFVTQEALPVAKDVTLHVAVAGRTLSLRGCIVRCREVLPGWYDGAVLFYEEEPKLALTP